MKSPANEEPPAERSTASAYQSGGQRGHPRLVVDPVAQVDQHRLARATPATPSRVRRNDETRMTMPDQEDHHHAADRGGRRAGSAVAATTMHQHAEREHHHPRQRAGPEHAGCRSPSGSPAW